VEDTRQDTYCEAAHSAQPQQILQAQHAGFCGAHMRRNADGPTCQGGKPLQTF